MSEFTPPPGANFLRGDLHIHTPASTDYEDKSASPEDFVQAALDAGLNFIAVTDHNSADWVDKIRSAARKTPLSVLPGVELTTPICHLLVLFDRDCKKEKIDEFLSVVGISIDTRGRKEAMSLHVEQVLEHAAEAGAIVVAAHANSSNGLLKHAKGQYKMEIASRDDLAGFEFSARDDIENFSEGKIPGYPPKACVQGSDSHSLKAIGQRATYFKLDRVSLRCLRQALLDHQVRIRFDWNLPRGNHPQILRLSVSQGFFAGTTFRFHPNLNCIIGGKGVGKSTLIELLRFGFEDVSGIEDIEADHVSKVAKLVGIGGQVSIAYLDSDSGTKLITRDVDEWNSGRAVTDSDGAPSDIVSSPVLFSQGELTRIAASLLAQLDLIDRYVDVQGDDSIEQSLIEQLNGNAQSLQEREYSRVQLDGELLDKQRGLKATIALYSAMEKKLKQDVLRTFPRWEAEERYLKETLQGFELLEGELESAVSQIPLPQMFPLNVKPEWPNAGQLMAVDREVAKIAPAIEENLRGLHRTLATVAADIRKVFRDWQPKFNSQSRLHDNALKQLGEEDVKKAQATLRSLGKRRDTLLSKQKELDGLAQEVDSLQRKRSGLLTQLAKCRAARFEKRSAKAAEWQSALGSKIRISVRESSDRSMYFVSLKTLLRGSSMREADLKSISTTIDPDVLVAIVENEDADTLAQTAQIRSESATKFIQALRSKGLGELLGVETVTLTDQPLIEYEVAPGRFKPLNELSVGQKGTVIISLALIEGTAPLVIDQPEEPLDTIAIHEQVVKTLRSEKDGRQFIFTTHNPNVAVGADAELSFVLDATADAGTISASGGIDEENTNELLLIHLEGGAEALIRRSRKYIRLE